MSMSFGGKLPDPLATAEFAAVVGLIEARGQRTRLTKLGCAFLELNPDHTYELTPAQKVFLAKEVVFAGPYREAIQDILSRFGEDRRRATYSCDLSVSDIGSTLAMSAVSFMRSIGVLKTDGGTAAIAHSYRGELSRLRAHVGLSPEELEEALRRQGEQGLAAEEWVLTHEKERLRKQKCLAEADAVYRVSEINICAGYDVASFDGRSPHFLFDRFIEVKSTSSPEPVFIWSRNELATAERVSLQYWIYLLTSFGVQGVGPSLYVIQNPAAKVAPHGPISLEPISFRSVLIQ